MTDDDFVIEDRDRLVVGFFVGRNWYHERRNTRSAVPALARRYGCGVYHNGSLHGFKAARSRILDALKATHRILSTGEYDGKAELAAEWPCWSHVSLLERDRFKDGEVDGGFP